MVTNLSNYTRALRKYLEPGPAHIAMYLAGRFQPVRAAVVRCKRSSGAANVAEPDFAQSSLEPIDLNHVKTSLETQGVTQELKLKPEVVAQLQEFAATASCQGDGDPNKAFVLSDKESTEQQYGKRFSTGRFVNCAERCTAIRQLVEDSVLRSIARVYLGAEPVLIGARLWWSFASDSDLKKQLGDGQAFHYDLDDYRAIAFFFYLTDVDAGSGPHVCVPGSHRRKPLRFLLSAFKSRTDKEIEAEYGATQMTICGTAGTGFGEDIFCYHKGSHPTSRDRLILQIRYRYRAYGKEGCD